MRRPVFFWSLWILFFITIAFRVWYEVLRPRDTGPGDGTKVVITGTVLQKDESSFLLSAAEYRLAEDNSENKSENSSRIKSESKSKSKSENMSAGSSGGQSGNESERILETVSGKINQKFPYLRKIQCEYDKSGTPAVGSKVIVSGFLYIYQPPTNPGEFDVAGYYHSLGYGGRLKKVELLYSEKGEGLAFPRTKLLDWLSSRKTHWKERLYHVFPEKEASVMVTILLGDRTGLDEDIKELYGIGGILHILSISGLHISIIGMGLYKGLRKLGLPVWVCSYSGILLLLLYGMMTGMGVSICRAVGMYMLCMLAKLTGRTYDMQTALGVVAVVLAGIHPEWTTNMGFWLSFGAAFGAGGVFPLFARKIRKVDSNPVVAGKMRQLTERLIVFGRNRGLALLESLKASLCISVITMPIQLYFSYEVAVYGCLLNLLVLPLMGALMVTGLLVMLVPGSGILGTIAYFILKIYEAGCKAVERIPGAVWNPGQPKPWQVVLSYLLMAAAIWAVPLFLKKERKTKALFGKIRVGLFGAAVVILALPFGKERVNQVSFLDVGQGDCCIVEFESGEVFLFDCGSSSRSKVGERVLLPYLKMRGIHKIDAVFLSHGDSDHINGVEELLDFAGQERIAIGQIFLPSLDEDTGQKEFAEFLSGLVKDDIDYSNRVQFVRAGDCFRKTDGKNYIVCVAPGATGARQGGNVGSACFFIKFSQKSLLLTGDVEGEGEQELMQTLHRLEMDSVDLLKVAHHGSRYSSSSQILKQIRPDYAVISAGKRNRYGHPHEEVLDRLEAAGIRWGCTKDYGAMIIRENRKGKLCLHTMKKFRKEKTGLNRN